MALVQTIFKEELECLKLEKTEKLDLVYFDVADVLILFLFCFSGFFLGSLFAYVFRLQWFLMLASGLVITSLLVSLLLIAIFIAIKLIKYLGWN